ncbi:hypothetical protein HK105_200382 [Polyrhizophydium stewartii]|uniref:Uncharacterized protein n=1 Tax=Polyrhizophydium stewartii TaxID=2732419 RepID=A0ABR4NLI2_9FUNG
MPPATPTAPAQTHGAASPDPDGAYLPLALVRSFAPATTGIAFAVLAVLAALAATVLLVRRGAALAFTPAVIALAAINVAAALLQLAEALHIYVSPPENAFYVLRNIWLPLCGLALNMLQIQVAAVFQGSVVAWSWLARGSLAKPLIVAFAAHLLCCAPTYLQGWLIPYDNNSLGYKWSTYGAAAYSLLVALCGIALNLLILINIQRYIIDPIRRGAVAKGAISALDACKRAANIIGTIVVIVLVLDVSAFFLFIASTLYSEVGDQAPAHYAYAQISLALFGLHMSAETIAFERIVELFKRMSLEWRRGSSSLSDSVYDAAVAADMADAASTGAHVRHRRRDTLSILAMSDIASAPSASAAASADLDAVTIPASAASEPPSPPAKSAISIPEPISPTSPGIALPVKAKHPRKPSVTSIVTRTSSNTPLVLPSAMPSPQMRPSISNEIAELWNAAWPWASRPSSVPATPRETDALAHAQTPRSPRGHPSGLSPLGRDLQRQPPSPHRQPALLSPQRPYTSTGSSASAPRPAS